MLKRLFPFMVLTLLLFLSGSSFPMVYNRIDAPEFDLTNLKRLAVVPFETNENGLIDGLQIADRLATHLAQEGYLSMIERMQIEKVMNEGKFSRSDFVDPAVAAKFGQLLGAEAIIIGRVEAKYTEKEGYTTVEKYVDENQQSGSPSLLDILLGTGDSQKQTGEKRTVQVRTLDKLAEVNIDTKVVDVETGLIIASKVAYNSWKKRGVDNQEIEALPPQGDVLEDCIMKCMDILIRAYTPHKVSIDRDLRPKKASGEEKDAIHLAESGLYEDAAKAFELIIEKDSSKNDIRGDLAIVYEALGNFEKADYWLSEAVKHGKSAHDTNDIRNSMLKSWYFVQKKNVTSRPVIILEFVNDKIYMDAGSIRQIKAGDRYKVCRETVITHPVSGEKMGSDLHPIAIVEITEVQEKMSIAKIIQALDSSMTIQKLDIAIPVEK